MRNHEINFKNFQKNFFFKNQFICRSGCLNQSLGNRESNWSDNNSLKLREQKQRETLDAALLVLNQKLLNSEEPSKESGSELLSRYNFPDPVVYKTKNKNQKHQRHFAKSICSKTLNPSALSSLNKLNYSSASTLTLSFLATSSNDKYASLNSRCVKYKRSMLSFSSNECDEMGRKSGSSALKHSVSFNVRSENSLKGEPPFKSSFLFYFHLTNRI
jgi:hypothetical protein